MEKIRITRKEILSRHTLVICCGNELQTLLYYEQAWAYSTRVEGWACDYFSFGDVCLSRGYAAIGKGPYWRLMDKYEKKARNCLEKTRYTKSHKWREKIFRRWIYKFIEEVKGL